MAYVGLGLTKRSLTNTRPISWVVTFLKPIHGQFVFADEGSDRFVKVADYWAIKRLFFFATLNISTNIFF